MLRTVKRGIQGLTSLRVRVLTYNVQAVKDKERQERILKEIQEQAQYSSDRLTRDYEETSRSRSIQGESRRRPSCSLALQACQGSGGQQSESRSGIGFG